MPLCSYDQTSLRFWYYGSLGACSKNLEKRFGVTEEIRKKAGIKALMGGGGGGG